LNVVENSTGNFTLGAGFSQAEHFTISGGISKAMPSVVAIPYQLT